MDVMSLLDRLSAVLLRGRCPCLPRPAWRTPLGGIDTGHGDEG